MFAPLLAVLGMFLLIPQNFANITKCADSILQIYNKIDLRYNANFNENSDTKKYSNPNYQLIQDFYANCGLDTFFNASNENIFQQSKMAPCYMQTIDFFVNIFSFANSKTNESLSAFSPASANAFTNYLINIQSTCFPNYKINFLESKQFLCFSQTLRLFINSIYFQYSLATFKYTEIGSSIWQFIDIFSSVYHTCGIESKELNEAVLKYYEQVQNTTFFQNIANATQYLPTQCAIRVFDLVSSCANAISLRSISQLKNLSTIFSTMIVSGRVRQQITNVYNDCNLQMVSNLSSFLQEEANRATEYSKYYLSIIWDNMTTEYETVKKSNIFQKVGRSIKDASNDIFKGFKKVFKWGKDQFDRIRGKEKNKVQLTQNFEEESKKKGNEL